MKKACCKSCKEGKVCDSKKLRFDINNYSEQEETDHSHNPDNYPEEIDESIYYQGCGKAQGNKDLNDFKKSMAKLSKIEANTYRPIEFFKYKQTLFEALVFPEHAKGIKLPAPFQIPTYCFQQKSSFVVSTNLTGNAYVQVNLGQFLDAAMYKTGSAGSQNGTSTVGNSNVFVCSHASLDGTTPVSNIGTVMTTSNILQVASGTFNAVRSGPASVRVDYIGRLDISAGNVTMGINYTSVADPANITTSVNGLYPDVTYSVLTALEDSPYARTRPITDSLKGVYVPHDYNALNLRSPGNAGVIMPQRLFILFTSGPVSSAIARVTITHNWEAVPAQAFSDLLTLTAGTFPSDYDGKEIYDFIMHNNLIITANELEYGIFKHIHKED